MSVGVLYNEKELLLGIAAGDEQAFRRIFDAYHGKLYNYLQKLTGSHETAQDIVHDVFLKIWQQKEQLPAVQQLSAYLYRMAHNRAFNGFRSLAVRKLAQEQLIYGTAGSGNEIEDNYAAKEIRVLIKTLAKKLTPQQQQVFEMSRGEGLKNEEIAARLGISVFTVKKHLTNALHFLRKEISGSLGAQVIVIYMAGVIFL